LKFAEGFREDELPWEPIRETKSVNLPHLNPIIISHPLLKTPVRSKPTVKPEQKNLITSPSPLAFIPPPKGIIN